MFDMVRKILSPTISNKAVNLSRSSWNSQENFLEPIATLESSGLFP